MSRPTPLRPAPPGAPAFGATAALRRWFGPAYDWRLGWPRPDGPKLLPVDPWPGDAVSGSTWLADPGRADPAFGDHGFAWLRDLRAVGGDEARHIGRQCILDWVGRHGRWHPDAWAPAVTGARLQSWLYGYEFFLGAADDDSRARVLQSVARQIRHLAWHRPPATPGAGLAAALGVVFGRLALEGRVAPETELEPALAAIGRSLLDDGLHVSRSPAVHLAVLADVVGLRALLVQADLAVPLALSTAIDRMAPVARMLRHGDGGLALFHGRAQHRMPGLVSGAVDRVSNEGRPAVTDAVIARAGGRGRPPRHLPDGGFSRLSANRTLVVLDSGPAMDDGHAAPGAVEISVGRERLVTNCGIWPQARSEADRAWAEALAGASAHSTLIADETLPEPAAVPTQAPSQAPMPGTAIAEDGLEAHALSAGYLARLGLIHARRLRLSAVGDRIEGEDRMAPPTGIATGPGHRGGTRVHVRFHLHPAVRASVIQDGQAVLLRLASGIGWRFEADFDAQGGDLAVADSVYCGGGAGAGAFPRKTHQIVLTTRTVGEGLALSWRFSRERKA